MPRDRYAANKQRDRVNAQHRDAAGSNAVVLHQTWIARNDEHLKLANELLAAPNCSEATKNRIGAIREYLAGNNLRALTPGQWNWLKAVRHAVIVQNRPAEEEPSQNANNRRKRLAYRRGARASGFEPDWARDPALLPAKPPCSTRAAAEKKTGQ